MVIPRRRAAAATAPHNLRKRTRCDEQRTDRSLSTAGCHHTTERTLVIDAATSCTHPSRLAHRLLPHGTPPPSEISKFTARSALPAFSRDHTGGTTPNNHHSCVLGCSLALPHRQPSRTLTPNPAYSMLDCSNFCNNESHCKISAWFAIWRITSLFPGIPGIVGPCRPCAAGHSVHPMSPDTVCVCWGERRGKAGPGQPNGNPRNLNR